ncbi:hypothetical protein LINGRAHAP2_LOCUS29600 [Linum grandiflorum]
MQVEESADQAVTQGTVDDLSTTLPHSNPFAVLGDVNQVSSAWLDPPDVAGVVDDALTTPSVMRAQPDEEELTLRKPATATLGDFLSQGQKIPPKKKRRAGGRGRGTFVYASTSGADQRVLFGDILRLKQSLTPWFIAGDFNAILKLTEASNVPSSLSSMVDFQDFVEECEILEHPSQGPNFTWSNNRPEDPIARRLDRVFINGVGQVRNTVRQIQAADGCMVENFDEIAAVFIAYYTSLLGTSEVVEQGNLHTMIRRRLSSSQQEDLIVHVNRREVKNALFDMHSDKSPGPDGFNAGLFNRCWSTVGDSVTEAVLHFFADAETRRNAVDPSSSSRPAVRPSGSPSPVPPTRTRRDAVEPSTEFFQIFQIRIYSFRLPSILRYEKYKAKAPPATTAPPSNQATTFGKLPSLLPVLPISFLSLQLRSLIARFGLLVCFGLLQFN